MKVHHTIILIVCVMLLAASLLLEPGQDSLYLFGFKWPVHCALHKNFGIKCSLCGLSRSFTWLGHGNLQKSMEFHRLGPALFAFMFIQIPYRIYAIRKGQRKLNIKIMKINTCFAVIIATAVFVNWIVYLGGRIL